MIDGANTVDCFANLEDCQEDIPRFRPLDENDELVSEASITDEPEEETEYETILNTVPVMETQSGSLRSGSIQYLAVNDEERYGVIVFSVGTIVYFEYDSDEEDF